MYDFFSNLRPSTLDIFFALVKNIFVICIFFTIFATECLNKA